MMCGGWKWCREGTHKARIFQQANTNSFIRNLVVSQKRNVVGGRDASVGCTEIKLIDGDNFSLMGELYTSEHRRGDDIHSIEPTSS